jgi:DNA-binding transcriptional MerR regulator
MERMGELPPKLFFRIGEVAGLVGVEPHVLRYWEREFRSIRPTKSAKGQRVYSRKDVENLLRVRDLLYRDGFTIAGAKKKLQRGTEEAVFADVDYEPATEPTPTPPESGAAITAEAEAADWGGLSAAPSPCVREKLFALRCEVEEFLAELSSNTYR